MKLHKWSAIKAKNMTPDRQRELEREAVDELIQMDLRALREAAGLTQEELAEKLESTQSQLSKLESGGDRRLSTLRRYVEAIGGKMEVVAVVRGRRVKLAGV